MRRPTLLALVLVNGGILMGAGHGAWRLKERSAACEEARAAVRPEAEELCRAREGRGGGGSAMGASAETRRGGFGTTAAHLSAGG